MSRTVKPTATTNACNHTSYGNVICFALCGLMQCHMFGHVAGVESTIDIDGVQLQIVKQFVSTNVSPSNLVGNMRC